MNNWDGIVSLFIACLEFVLIINILVFSEKTRQVKLGLALISLLFSYQLMEFLICGAGFNGALSAYIAFMFITFLPPLSLLFAGSVAGRDSKLLYLGFAPALFFVLYYGFLVKNFSVIKCSVFYASYNYPLGDLYGFFYYSLVIAAVTILYIYFKKETERKKRVLTAVLLTGFAVAFLPVITAFLLAFTGNNILLDKIESIMCKFALSVALAAGIYCLSYLKKK